MAGKETVRLGTNYNQLFTVEEALVRLSQNHQTGDLLILNMQESVEVFVEDGFVVSAHGPERAGEEALRHGLDLPASNFVWIVDAAPISKDIQIDLREYLLRRSLARDVYPEAISAQKRETLPLPRKESVHQPEEDVDILDAGFYLVPESNPTWKMVLNRRVSLVGREVYCDWVIDDARVSRKHCLLQLNNRGVLVRDLDSINGTFVNGKAVGDSYMKVWDRLSLGGYTLILKRENPEKSRELESKQQQQQALAGRTGP